MRRCRSETAATTLPSTRPASCLTFSSLICSFLVYANDCILSFDLSLSCLHVRLNPLDLLLSYLHVPLNPFDLLLSRLYLSESSRSVAFLPACPSESFRSIAFLPASLRILSIHCFPVCLLTLPSTRDSLLPSLYVLIRRLLYHANGGPIFFAATPTCSRLSALFPDGSSDSSNGSSDLSNGSSDYRSNNRPDTSSSDLSNIYSTLLSDRLHSVFLPLPFLFYYPSQSDKRNLHSVQSEA